MAILSVKDNSQSTETKMSKTDISNLGSKEFENEEVNMIAREQQGRGSTEEQEEYQSEETKDEETKCCHK